jgi:hypothetical protein
MDDAQVAKLGILVSPTNPERPLVIEVRKPSGEFIAFVSLDAFDWCANRLAEYRAALAAARIEELEADARTRGAMLDEVVPALQARIAELEAALAEAKEFAQDVEETCSHPMTLVSDARALLARLEARPPSDKGEMNG